MTLRSTEHDRLALRGRADAEGISTHNSARRAGSEYVIRGDHPERVAVAAERVLAAHADALGRLGR